MRTEKISGSVIWRLPGSEEIHVLESSGGNDQFLVSFFDRGKTSKIIQGETRKTGISEIPLFFEKWMPGKAPDKTSTSREDYIHWVQKAKAEIALGHFSKVVMARREWQHSSARLSELFSQLLSHHGNAFVYAFNMDNRFIMIGASPETLLYKRGDQLYTEALGGTWTRDDFHDKERLEHGHIYQYIESVLSNAGYTYKTDPTTSRNAGSVQHLLTPFMMQSQGFDKDMELAFRLHPTSAVCGMPYQQAFDFIGGTENFDRGYYSGFLGPVEKGSDFNFFVNLRCAELYDEGVVLYAGAGLNSMSDPEDEWDETARKMETISQWI